MKIGMISLGCPKNLTDSETMLGLISSSDEYEIVSDINDAEIIIINTCAFINDAKQESIDTILEMAEYKKENLKKIIVCGCLAERYHDEIKKELPEVDAVVGCGDFYKILDVLDSLKTNEFVNLNSHQNDPVPENLPRILATPSHTAYLKIAEGCDNMCTFCAIPQIRGKYRSRKVEDIVSEARSLAQKGVKELILIAQDTSRYGKDIYGRYSLDRLLKELCKIESLHWIRIHYFYPEALSEEVLDIMAHEKKILNYIDMPIQHIDDEILSNMARHTDSIEIEKKIALIRKKLPDCIIRTSLITGFPGESEKAHKKLYDFLEKAELDRVGIFAYSKEENTPAALFDLQVPEDIKQKRLDELMLLQKEISQKKNEQQLGKVLEVLCEGYDSENFMYYGRSYMDSPEVDSLVYFAAEDEVPIGSFTDVEILNYDEYDLIGKQVL